MIDDQFDHIDIISIYIYFYMIKIINSINNRIKKNNINHLFKYTIIIMIKYNKHEEWMKILWSGVLQFGLKGIEMEKRLRLRGNKRGKDLRFFWIFLILGLILWEGKGEGRVKDFEERGAMFYEEGKYEIAQELLERAFEENALSQRVYFYLGNIYYIKEEYEKAIGTYQKGLEISEGERRRVIEYNLGRAYQKGGDYELARERYGNLVGIVGYEEVYFNLGLMSYEEKDLEGVKKWWGEYVRERGSKSEGKNGGKVDGGEVDGGKVDGGEVDGGKVDEGKVDEGKVDEGKRQKEGGIFEGEGFGEKKKRVKKILERIDQKIIIMGSNFLDEMGDGDKGRDPKGEEIIIDLERDEEELIGELELEGEGLEKEKEEVDIEGEEEVKFKEVEQVILEIEEGK